MTFFFADPFSEVFGQTSHILGDCDKWEVYVWGTFGFALSTEYTEQHRGTTHVRFIDPLRVHL